MCVCAAGEGPAVLEDGGADGANGVGGDEHDEE